MSNILKYVAMAALVGNEQANAVFLKSEVKGFYDGAKFEVNMI